MNETHRTTERCTHAMKLLAGALVGCLGLSQTALADDATYGSGQTVKVWINWQTFTEVGWPDDEYGDVRDAVIHAYTRWEQVAGMDLDFEFMGTTTRAGSTESCLNCGPDGGPDLDFRPDEVVVKANRTFIVGQTRIAGVYNCNGTPRCRQLVLYREGVGGTQRVFNYFAGDGAAGADMVAVLVHEFGHVLGIDDQSGTGNTMDGGYAFNRRYGPYRDGVDRALALYGKEARNRIKLRRSTNYGLSWSDFGSLPTLRTSTQPAAVRDDSTLMLSYSNDNKDPCWIMGSSTGSFDTGKWFCFGAHESRYGQALAGDGGEYMMAFVALEGANERTPTIKTVYGTRSQWESASGLVLRSPPSASSTTYGTPALARLGSNRWVLSYAKYSTVDGDCGRVVARVSEDDGRSWSDEFTFNDLYVPANGVGMSGQSADGSFRIGFAWASYRNGNPAGRLIRTLQGHYEAGDLEYDSVRTGSDTSDNQPGMTQAASYVYHAFRGTNTRTYIRRSANGTTSWTDPVGIAETLYAPPALAADRSYNYVFLFQPVR